MVQCVGSPIQSNYLLGSNFMSKYFELPHYSLSELRTLQKWEVQNIFKEVDCIIEIPPSKSVQFLTQHEPKNIVHTI